MRKFTSIFKFISAYQFSNVIEMEHLRRNNGELCPKRRLVFIGKKVHMTNNRIWLSIMIRWVFFKWKLGQNMNLKVNFHLNIYFRNFIKQERSVLVSNMKDINYLAKITRKNFTILTFERRPHFLCDFEYLKSFNKFLLFYRKFHLSMSRNNVICITDQSFSWHFLHLFISSQRLPH